MRQYSDPELVVIRVLRESKERGAPWVSHEQLHDRSSLDIIAMVRAKDTLIRDGIMTLVGDHLFRYKLAYEPFPFEPRRRLSALAS